MSQPVDAIKLWGDVVRERDVLRIHGRVALTKGPAGDGCGIYLRDLDLERRAMRWLLGSGGSQEEMLNGFRRSVDETVAWPTHVAARTVGVDGVLAHGDNVFMVFPLALGESASPGCPDFGIEFVDVWEAALWQVVFPCVRLTMAVESGCDLALALGPDLSVVAFAVAVLHEIGHQVGFFRVLPGLLPENRTESYIGGTLSELYSDCSVAARLGGKPAAAAFIMLCRTFWFGRRGSLGNSPLGRLNTDSDCLIGAYLWERARRDGLITGEAGSYRMSAGELPGFFASIRDDLDDLGHRLRGVPSGEMQSALACRWLKRFVPWDRATQRFLLPRGFLEMCLACQSIPENPRAPERGAVFGAQAGGSELVASGNTGRG